MFWRRYSGFLVKKWTQFKINCQKNPTVTKTHPEEESHIFGKYLLVTNTVSGGALMFIGDLVEQEIEYRKKIIPVRYDYKRLLNMTIVGIALGPLHHYFYIYLHKFFPKQNLNHVLKKIALDQFIMSPVCIAAFFYTICYLENSPIEQCNRELSEKYWDIYTVDWLVWPPTQCINFYFVPVKYQVIYINVVTMLYNVFLSFMKYKKEESCL